MRTFLLITFFVLAEIGTFICGYVLGQVQQPAPPYDAIAAAEQHVEPVFAAWEAEDA